MLPVCAFNLAELVICIHIGLTSFLRICPESTRRNEFCENGIGNFSLIDPEGIQKDVVLRFFMLLADLSASNEPMRNSPAGTHTRIMP